MVILIEVLAFIMISFDFPSEKHILQENINSCLSSLDVVMKMAYMEHSFTHSALIYWMPII